MIDKQIRCLVETEVKHRKLNNYGLGGKLLSLLTGLKAWFVALEYWYGGNKLLLGKQMFSYNKKYEKVYDSYRLFADMAGSAGAGVCAGEGHEVAGPRGTAPAPEDTAQPETEEAMSSALPPPDTATPGSCVGSG